MNAEVITIGTELLLGQIIDTNAAYLGKKLAEVGVNLYFKTTAGDNIERVKSVLETACKRADLVLITGGLGPTVDDITREAVAQFANSPLILDKEALKKIDHMFSSRGLTMTENNKLQAYIPQGANSIENNNGTAPGFIIEYKSTIIAVMPGVPSEMYPMMETAIMPYLIKKMGGTHQVIISKLLKVIGLGESRVDDKIQDLFKKSENPTIGVYAHINEVEVRLTAKANNETEAHKLIEALKKQVYERLGTYIYGEDEETLENKIAEILLKKKMKVSTAESCTSGLVAHRLTNVPGSSAYFTGGINSYANEVKTDILGVQADIIKQYGAVSPESAEAMAKAARKIFKTDCAIAVTGIAGPDGGTAEKPVGLVYIGIDIKGKVEVYKNNFIGSRENVRIRATHVALYHFLRGIEKI
ncbi:MAG: competence/damage-inducible protein A [bacterium]